VFNKKSFSPGSAQVCFHGLTLWSEMNRLSISKQIWISSVVPHNEIHGIELLYPRLELDQSTLYEDFVDCRLFDSAAPRSRLMPQPRGNHLVVMFWGDWLWSECIVQGGQDWKIRWFNVFTISKHMQLGKVMFWGQGLWSEFIVEVEGVANRKNPALCKSHCKRHTNKIFFKCRKWGDGCEVGEMSLASG